MLPELTFVDPQLLLWDTIVVDIMEFIVQAKVYKQVDKTYNMIQNKQMYTKLCKSL